MQIPKEQIPSLLKGQGDEGKAQQAGGELPDTVDIDEHAGLLATLGIDPADLLSKLVGGGAAGGIAGKLGL